MIFFCNFYAFNSFGDWPMDLRFFFMKNRFETLPFCVNRLNNDGKIFTINFFNLIFHFLNYWFISYLPTSAFNFVILIILNFLILGVAVNQSSILQCTTQWFLLRSLQNFQICKNFTDELKVLDISTYFPPIM